MEIDLFPLFIFHVLQTYIWCEIIIYHLLIEISILL